MQCNQNMRLAVKRKHETNEPTTVSWNVERMATWCDGGGEGGRASVGTSCMNARRLRHTETSPLYSSLSNRTQRVMRTK